MEATHVVDEFLLAAATWVACSIAMPLTSMVFELMTNPLVPSLKHAIVVFAVVECTNIRLKISEYVLAVQF
jgi:hypothetical protein